MRRIARGGTLLADAILALNDGRFARNQVQPNRISAARARRRQRPSLAMHLRTPRPVPDASRGRIDTCQADSGAGDFLVVEKLPGVDIAEGEVREVKIVDAPAGGIRVRIVHSFAEESQLIAEAVAVRRRKIAGEVPPLRAVARMREMVSGKFEAVAGQRDTKFAMSGRRFVCRVLRAPGSYAMQQEERSQRSPRKFDDTLH